MHFQTWSSNEKAEIDIKGSPSVEIIIPTNLADALSVKDDTNTDFIVFDTTTAANAINIIPDTTISGALDVTGNTTLTTITTSGLATLDSVQVDNNANVTESRNLGLAFQRYQSSNDIGTGELVTDEYVFYDSIPNQSSASSNQIKFSNLLNSTNDYYNGWWVKVATGSNTNQVRRITSYNGPQRVATLNADWTGQNPGNGDTVYFYNSQLVYQSSACNILPGWLRRHLKIANTNFYLMTEIVWLIP